MSFFITPNAEPALDLIADKMVENPAFADRFDAIKELREDSYTADDVKRISRSDGFVRVASFVGPLLDLAQVLDPEFLAQGGKKRFYKFLDQHKEYCTYDRRRAQVAGDGLFHGFNEIPTIGGEPL
jgi:hypothetical protein